LKNSLARSNPLNGLTAEEYKDFAYALVSYVALHATVDQTTYFMSLYRHYTLEIASKVAVANKVGPDATKNAMASAFKTSLSH
jgi:hypothetical protein